MQVLGASTLVLLRMALAIFFCAGRGAAATAQAPAFEQQAGGQSGKRQKEQDQYDNINLHFFSSPTNLAGLQVGQPL
jgi:hypothetical protein